MQYSNQEPFVGQYLTVLAWYSPYNVRGFFLNTYETKVEKEVILLFLTMV